jgi:hypothetical protein
MRIQHKSESLKLREDSDVAVLDKDKMDAGLLQEIDRLINNISSLGNRTLRIVESYPEKNECVLKVGKMLKNEKLFVDVDGRITYQTKENETFSAEVLEIKENSNHWLLTLKGAKICH